MLLQPNLHTGLIKTISADDSHKLGILHTFPIKYDEWMEGSYMGVKLIKAP